MPPRHRGRGSVNRYWTRNLENNQPNIDQLRNAPDSDLPPVHRRRTRRPNSYQYPQQTERDNNNNPQQRHRGFNNPQQHDYFTRRHTNFSSNNRNNNNYNNNYYYYNNTVDQDSVISLSDLQPEQYDDDDDESSFSDFSSSETDSETDDDVTEINVNIDNHNINNNNNNASNDHNPNNINNNNSDEDDVIVMDVSIGDNNNANSNDIEMNSQSTTTTTSMMTSTAGNVNANDTSNPLTIDPSTNNDSEQQQQQQIVPAGQADTSMNDFKTPAKLNNNTNNNNNNNNSNDKKKKLEGSSERKKRSILDDSIDDSDSCPICFEPWTNSGLHRLVSLKCGHLFGQNCIEKWLPSNAKGKCPNCNSKAHSRDIRVIFAKRLKALDTSERDRLITELNEERRSKQVLELNTARSNMQMQHALDECQRLREENEKLKTTVQMNQVQIMMMMSNKSSSSSSSIAGQTSSSLVASSSSSLSSSSSQLLHHARSQSCFVFERSIKCDPGSCRVMTYHSQTSTLFISQQSPNPLFPGFGIKKLRTLDLKSHEYVPIHNKLIRDLAFSSGNSNSSSSNESTSNNEASGCEASSGCGNSQKFLLLTASMDKSLKITNVHSNQVVQSYECLSPVWSCCWHAEKPNYFFAGLQNGNVLMFDTRFNNQYVSSLTSAENSKSVVSLHYLPKIFGNRYRPGGLIAGQLDNSIFFECRDTTFTPSYLPFEGLLSSLSVENATGHVLASFRPNSQYQFCRHQLYSLSFSPSTTTAATATSSDTQQQLFTSTVHCNNIQTFHGSPSQKRLLRSRLMLHPDHGMEKLLICAGNESNKSVEIWNSSNGLKQQSIPATSDDVIDICPVTDDVSNKPYMLAVLNDKEVNVYKWG